MTALRPTGFPRGGKHEPARMRVEDRCFGAPRRYALPIPSARRWMNWWACFKESRPNAVCRFTTDAAIRPLVNGPTSKDLALDPTVFNGQIRRSLISCECSVPWLFSAAKSMTIGAGAARPRCQAERRPHGVW